MGLYDVLLNLHSGGRWIVLILLLIAIFRHASGGNSAYITRDNRIGLLLTIFADIMLLVGIYLWFVGNWGYKQIENFGGMGEVMKNSTARFYVVEHLLGMLIAIILIHIGKAQGKKSIPDRSKHRKATIFYVIALILILLSIPWPFREIGLDRGWF